MLEIILASTGLLISIISVLTFTKVQRSVSHDQPKRNLIEPFIPWGEDFNVQNLEASPQPAFRKDAKFHMTMGLRKLDKANWLTIDKNYSRHYDIRTDLLHGSKERVLQCLPGSEDACAETLEVVVDFLTQKYSQMFEFWGGAEGRDWIRNNETSEVFQVRAPYMGMAPLEIAARLAMEDFNVLLKSELDGKHHLLASATLFPAGWYLQERIGWPIGTIHEPVPKWQEKVGAAVERYFGRMTTENSMERSSYFVQATRPTESLRSILFHPDPFNTGNTDTLTAEDIILRCERQTFCRLPRSGAVLFTVKTAMTPLTSLSEEEREAFRSEAKSWPVDTAAYKGRDFWGEIAS
ncbi:MAG: hypothetical protein M1835_000323, partial [Candelina submexicana]